MRWRRDQHDGVRRMVGLALGLLVALGLTGCGDGDCTARAPAAVECLLTAELDGVTYHQVGTSRHTAEPSRGAQVSGCASDPGCPADQVGAGRVVRVWAFDGTDERQVVGVQLQPGLYAVLVSTDLSPARTQALETRLAAPVSPG